jgi:hypothetical protein
MSAQEGHPPHPSATHHDAGVHRVERVLRSYGPLTRQTLYDLSGARCWPDGATFDAVLEAAVAAGRVRSLGGVLFEAADGAPGTPLATAASATTER